MPRLISQTKHFQVARELRNYVKQLGPGVALPTHRELMKQFNASQATVDRALKRLRQEGLVHRPAGKQRVVVKRQADPAAVNLCLLRPAWPAPFYDAICQAIAESGIDRDWMFSYVTYRHMASIDLEMITSRYDAVVLMTSNEQIPAELARALAKPNIPMVLAQDHREGLTASSVCINDRQMARLATRHLLDLGHPRPVLALPSQVAGPMKHAVEGWRQAMEAAGVHDLDGLIANAATPPRHDGRQVVYEYWKKLLELPGPTPSAIFCANTVVALGVMRALREADLRVPEDVSIVAADAISGEGPFMCPPLTATSVQMSRYGNAVTSLIEGQLDGTITEPRQIWIDLELTVRQSTAPFRGNPNDEAFRVTDSREPVV